MRAITLRVAGSTMERVWSAFERTSNAFDGVLAACKLTPKPSRMIDPILAFMSPTISTVGTNAPMPAELRTNSRYPSLQGGGERFLLKRLGLAGAARVSAITHDIGGLRFTLTVSAAVLASILDHAATAWVSTFLRRGIHRDAPPSNGSAPQVLCFAETFELQLFRASC